MKKLLSILLLAICSYSSYSQTVPGYLGYRKSISYEAHLMPTFSNPTSADTSSSFLGMTYQSHLRFDWTLSKSLVIGLDAAFFNTYINLNDLILHSFSSGFGVDGENIQTTSENTKLSVNSFAVNFRWHRQHFAPLGKYFELRLGMINYSMEKFQYARVDIDSSITPKTLEIDPTPIYYVGAGIGTNHVIKDRFLISYGVNANYLFRGYNYSNLLVKDPDLEYYSFDGTDEEVARDANAHIEGRLFSHYLLNFKIGVGYLF